jgi:hypothetical protein
MLHWPFAVLPGPWHPACDLPDPALRVHPKGLEFLGGSISDDSGTAAKGRDSGSCSSVSRSKARSEQTTNGGAGALGVGARPFHVERRAIRRARHSHLEHASTIGVALLATDMQPCAELPGRLNQEVGAPKMKSERVGNHCAAADRLLSHSGSSSEPSEPVLVAPLSGDRSPPTLAPWCVPRFRPWARQTRSTSDRLVPSTTASERVLQHAPSVGRSETVIWTIRWMSSARGLGGRPSRGASLSIPATPNSANRVRHRATAALEILSSSAIATFSFPWAAARTTRARITRRSFRPTARDQCSNTSRSWSLSEMLQARRIGRKPQDCESISWRPQSRCLAIGTAVRIHPILR